jgi:hypothetical protein
MNPIEATSVEVVAPRHNPRPERWGVEERVSTHPDDPNNPYKFWGPFYSKQAASDSANECARDGNPCIIFRLPPEVTP